MANPSASPVNRTSPHWRELYQAAIRESDRTRIVLRIIEAERSIIRRERQLFLSSGNERELNALNVALHELDALRACLSATTPSTTPSQALFGKKPRAATNGVEETRAS